MTVKKNPRAILKKLIGKEVETIAEEIVKNKLNISEVLGFALEELTKKDYEYGFLRAIISLPIPKGKHNLERADFLVAVNNAIIFLCTQGKWKEAANLSDKFIDYVEDNIYIAHSAACAFAHVDEREKALSMVELAVKNDYKYLDLLEFDEDLASIKDDPRFIAAFEKPKLQRDGIDLMVNEKVGDKKIIFRLCEYVGDLKNKEIELIEGIKENYDEIIQLAYQGILEFYKLHYRDYKKGMEKEGLDHKDILPEPTKSLKIEKYLSGMEIYLKYTGRDLKGNFGLAFECTWDVEHGIGAKFKKFKLDKVCMQDDSFFRTYE